jgi:hypothetical protein
MTQGYVSKKGSKGSKGGEKGGGKGGKGAGAKTHLVSAPLDLASLPESPESIGTRGMDFFPPTLNGPTPGYLPYSNPYGIPGFDAYSFLRFQQLQANAAASSAAQLESKPKHLLASSAASFPAKGIPDDSVHVQRGSMIPRHNHENHVNIYLGIFRFYVREYRQVSSDCESLQLSPAQQEAGASYLIRDSESGNLAGLSLDRHTRHFVSKETSRPRMQSLAGESDYADEHPSSF